MINSKIHAVVFDLDGTLISSHANIYYAVIKTFKKFGRNVIIPEKEFYALLGHHFKDMFSALNIEVDDIEEFIYVYKNLYFEFINHSKPYEGVEETLKELKNNNVKIALLTTKGQDQAERIIEHFNYSKYFDLVLGRRPDMEIKPSPEPYFYICEKLNISPENSLMVGDSELDIRCGKNAGALTCGVSFGYRTIEQLKAEKPDYLINKISEVTNILKHSNRDKQWKNKEQ